MTTTTQTPTVLPKRVDLQVGKITLRELLGSVRQYMHYGLSSECRRFLFGFRIPNFQRDQKWSLDQRVSLMESLIRGWPAGSVILTRALYNTVDGSLHPWSNFVIDGQQRLDAIEAYLNDEFEVYGYKFSQLDAESRYRVLDIDLPAIVLDPQEYDYGELCDISDKNNYGGTVHLEAERAVKDELALRKIVHAADGSLMMIDGYGNTYAYNPDEQEDGGDMWADAVPLSTILGADEEEEEAPFYPGDIVEGPDGRGEVLTVSIDGDTNQVLVECLMPGLGRNETYDAESLVLIPA